jgi:hypothetical protein
MLAEWLAHSGTQGSVAVVRWIVLTVLAISIGYGLAALVVWWQR